MNIPQAHPRIWWNPARLARAKKWFASNGFTPHSDDPSALAFHHVMTGDRQSARLAIDWLMNLTFNVATATVSDPARWHGETAMLVYDWCHAHLTDGERATLIERWNTYVITLNGLSWGGVGMESNNYYWGYLRNSIEWALASYHENPKAPEILKHALETRWRDSFLPYALGDGRGGVPQEGSQYGRYTLSYQNIPLTSAAQLGNDMWSQTNFFREALLYVLYSTTPAPTVKRGTTDARYELFPFNDDQFFRQGGSAESAYYSSFLTTVIDRWRGTPLAGYAQSWLDQTRAPIEPIYASVFTPVEARPLSALPLDYYGAGAGFFYVRNAWTPDTTLVNLQLGRATGTGNGGHEHRDWGSFQIWRGGRWLSRETTGYVDEIAGWKGVGKADSAGPLAHNGGILFDGVSIASTANRKGPPRTVRLESRANHAFAAVDLTDAYRIAPDKYTPVERDNPYSKSVVREYLYVRPLETLLVFDRVESSGEKKAATDVTKSFVMHFETAPTVKGGNTVVGVNGDQALTVTTLIPAAPVYRVIDEGAPVGQHRLEVDAVGAPAQSHLLHVLQARGVSDPAVAAKVSDTAAGYEVTLTDPARGTAVVVFTKGMASSGGSFAFARSGTPTPVALTERVQTVRVTDNGPAWE